MVASSKYSMFSLVKHNYIVSKKQTFSFYQRSTFLSEWATTPIYTKLTIFLEKKNNTFQFVNCLLINNLS